MKMKYVINVVFNVININLKHVLIVKILLYT